MLKILKDKKNIIIILTIMICITSIIGLYTLKLSRENNEEPIKDTNIVSTIYDKNGDVMYVIGKSVDKKDKPIGNVLYADMVVNEVYEHTGLNPREISMEIHTFSDPEIQEYLNVYTETYPNYQDENQKVGASIQSVTDGRILGIIGERLEEDVTPTNNLATEKKSPGSILIPITGYALAFEYLGWDSNHVVKNMQYTNAGWNPTNTDGTMGDGKEITIGEALYHMHNLPAIWTFDELFKNYGSFQTVLETYERLGVDISAEQTVVSIAYVVGGWTRGISPVELSGVYATIANDGISIKPHTVNTVKVKETGKIFEIDREYQDFAQAVFSLETCTNLKNVLQEQLTYGERLDAFKHSNLNTITGQSKYRDDNSVVKTITSWTSSFNSDISVSIWMGNHSDPSSPVDPDASINFTKDLMIGLTDVYSSNSQQ